MCYNIKMKKLILIIITISLFRCSKSSNPELSNFKIADTLCVSSHIKTENDSSSQKIRTEELRLLSDAGIKYLRRDFFWHEIEPEKGNFDFSGYDRIVDEAQSYGMEFIGLLAYGNSWASAASRKCAESGMSGCIFYPPDNPDDFADFVRETVSHFKGRVNKWEIWNEPNLGINFFKPFSDPQKYSEILRVGFNEVKSVDPDAVVSFGGVLMPDYEIEPSGVEFIDSVFNVMPEAGNYFDVLAFHPYMYPYPPSIPPEQESPPSQGSIITMIDSIKENLSDRGAGEKPLWITEVGWPVVKNITEELQAAYLIRSLLLSAVKGVEIYCWYTTYDEDGTLFPEAENYFGLIKHYNPELKDEAEPKLAYVALKNLSSISKGFYIMFDDYKMSENVYKVTLVNPVTDDKLYVLWTDNFTQKTEIKMESNNYKVIDIYGEEITPEVVDSHLVIALSATPVYVLFSK
jgi:hypothetical protein